MSMIAQNFAKNNLIIEDEHIVRQIILEASEKSSEKGFTHSTVENSQLQFSYMHHHTPA